MDIEMLKDDLWPEADGDMAQSAFSTTLNRLRRILIQKEFFENRDGRLSLNPNYCWLDIWAFERSIKEAESLMSRGARTDAISAYQGAIAYYKGPFLSKEPQRHWMAPMRERLSLKYLKALGALGGIMEAENNFNEAIRLYKKGLEADSSGRDILSAAHDLL